MNKQILHIYVSSYIDNKHKPSQKSYSSRTLITTATQLKEMEVYKFNDLPSGIIIHKQATIGSNLTSHVISLNQIIDVFQHDGIKKIIKYSTEPILFDFHTNVSSLSRVINKSIRQAILRATSPSYAKMDINVFVDKILNQYEFLSYNIANRDLVIDVIKPGIELSRSGKFLLDFGCNLYKNKNNHILQELTNRCRTTALHNINIYNFRTKITKPKLEVVK